MTYTKYTSSDVEITAPLASLATTCHLPGCAPTNWNTRPRLAVVVESSGAHVVQFAVPAVHPLANSTNTSYVAAPVTGRHTSVVKRGKWSKLNELTLIDPTAVAPVALMIPPFAVLGSSFPCTTARRPVVFQGSTGRARNRSPYRC